MPLLTQQRRNQKGKRQSGRMNLLFSGIPGETARKPRRGTEKPVAYGGWFFFGCAPLNILLPAFSPGEPGARRTLPFSFWNPTPFSFWKADVLLAFSGLSAYQILLSEIKYG